jgi:hypothetical protein
MMDVNVVELFHSLNTRYPMAAAGLIEQLCSDLSRLLESKSCDDRAVASLCDALSQCFRPMDRMVMPDCYPWDRAYAIFGRWILRGLPKYKAALIAITGWSDEQVASCQRRYILEVRANRDDWTRAAQSLDDDQVG